MRYLLAIALALTACARTHDVATLGPDLYTVSASASSARGGASGSRSLAIERAGEFCRANHKDLVVLSVTGTVTSLDGAGSADVNFRCA